MIKKSSWLKILAGLGCATLLTLGCLIGLLALAFTSTMHSNDLESWEALIGQKVSPRKLPGCATEWQLDQSQTRITCDTLQGQLPFAPAEKTGVAITTNANRQAQLIDFTLHGVENYQLKNVDDTIYVASWEQMAIKQILAKDCAPISRHYADIILQQCTHVAYGLALPTPSRRGRLNLPDGFTGHIWIGRKTSEFKPLLHTWGHYSSQKHSQLALMTAEDLLKEKDFLNADKALIGAAYYALQTRQPDSPNAPDAKFLQKVAKNRLQIRSQLVNLRKQKRLDPPLPSHNSLLDLPFLLHKTQSDIELVLGKPRGCKTMTMPSTGKFPRCTYGGDAWQIEVSFIEQKSARLTFTILSGHLPFARESLAKLQIPVAKPGKSTSTTLQWNNIAGLKELTLQTQKPDRTVVSARVR